MGITEDIKITDRIATGDEEAFKELFDLYYKPLCVYAIKFIDSFDDAEDIVQSIFASFWIRYSRRQFTGSLRAYLFSSVRNNCMKLSNTEKGRPISETDFVQEVEDIFLFMENAENEHKLISAEIEKLNREVEKLPPQCRKVFNAVIMEDMKYKDAAGMLGISVNTVKTQISRALKHLRGSMGTILIILLLK
jgi:RNA polymerase sigma-70 factor (ECF subfamily)